MDLLPLIQGCPSTAPVPCACTGAHYWCPLLPADLPADLVGRDPEMHEVAYPPLQGTEGSQAHAAATHLEVSPGAWRKCAAHPGSPGLKRLAAFLRRRETAAAGLHAPALCRSFDEEQGRWLGLAGAQGACSTGTGCLLRAGPQRHHLDQPQPPHTHTLVGMSMHCHSHPTHRHLWA